MSPAVVLFVSDGVYGRPAAGMPVRLESTTPNGEQVRIFGETDGGGRWAPDVVRPPGPGLCWLAVDSASYYATLGVASSVAELVVAVRLGRDADPQRVSLVVAPHGHAVYVGL